MVAFVFTVGNCSYWFDQDLASVFLEHHVPSQGVDLFVNSFVQSLR